ncbi:hypothetical protein TNCV_2310791 [Trichonephila clavipes]|nr:hypothetical protein TNCV_2310791 [Trichonephila clavipes]
MWFGIILLKNKARVLQKERLQKSSQNERRRTDMLSESGIDTLPWTSPDASSMIVRTQMEAGFVAIRLQSA